MAVATIRELSCHLRGQCPAHQSTQQGWRPPLSTLLLLLLHHHLHHHHHHLACCCRTRRREMFALTITGACTGPGKEQRCVTLPRIHPIPSPSLIRSRLAIHYIPIIPIMHECMHACVRERERERERRTKRDVLTLLNVTTIVVIINNNNIANIFTHHQHDLR